MTIQQTESGNTTIKIEGKIVGPSVTELDRAWRELELTLGDRKLSVDLCGVMFMDGKARDLLAEIYAKTHAAFIADTPLTKYFAQQARKDNHIGIGDDPNFNSEFKARRQS